MVDVDLKSLLDPRTLVGGGLKLAERFGDEAIFVALCIRSGLVRPELPHKVAQMLVAFERHGMLSGAVTIGAIRNPDQVAVRDEVGDLTYRDLDQRSNALANAWRDDGLEPGDGVAILARNHRGFFDAVFAAAKCGARIVLLNTSFSGPQIREVADREGTDLLVYDDEYSKILKDIEPPHGRWRAWVDDDDGAEDTLEHLIKNGDTSGPPKAGKAPKIVILTSGTTGTPKGAPRDEPKSLGMIGGLLGKVPFRARETTELCVPMFHALGFAHMALGLALGSTLVIRRHFDPEATLDSLQDNEATAMIVVPVMLQRILELGEEAIKERDLSHLKIIFASGSAMGTDLVKRALEAFGPVVYNLYGSTEIAYATIATPEDLEDEPSTVGSVVRGSIVKIYGEDGKEVDKGDSGRIFVGNLSQFEGYTGGGSKEEHDGLMSSGDVGHLDEKGRLFIDGRDDEMIVSGGENVFPAEIEELLAGHGSIEEAAAIGVDDEKFGQRLKAFVVLRKGKQLDEDGVKDYVKDNTARYKVPREVVFVDELPRNSTGKVLKRELAEADDEDGKSKSASGSKTKSSSSRSQSKSSGGSRSKSSSSSGTKRSSSSSRSKSNGSSASRRSSSRATSKSSSSKSASGAKSSGSRSSNAKSSGNSKASGNSKSSSARSSGSKSGSGSGSSKSSSS
ncbi:MAG: acyl-CoA synthetase [Solirubrobacteraceae bacterium]